MHHTQNLKIVAFVGLTGSGKSTAVKYLTEKGYPRVYFGGVIYSEMDKRGIEITPESQAVFRKQIRKEQGNDFVVNRIIDEIHDLAGAGQHRIVADGVYSWTEYKQLKHAYPGELTTIAIVSPRHLRHHRLTLRADRPFTELEATERDWDEIENLEKGGPIAMADYTVLNEKEPDDLYRALDAILEKIEF